MYKDNEGDRAMRKPGRPVGTGKRNYRGKCDVRLSAEEDSILNALADRNGVSRSDIVRKAIRDFWKFNSEE